MSDYERIVFDWLEKKYRQLYRKWSAEGRPDYTLERSMLNMTEEWLAELDGTWTRDYVPSRREREDAEKRLEHWRRLIEGEAAP